MAVMNARIEYEDEDSGERGVITLVHPGIADDRSGRVSVLAPLGMALLGLREGQTVDWPLQHGRRRRVRLVRVLRAPRRHAAGG
jgi:regulator of nucleoside diphosphate kinase